MDRMTDNQRYALTAAEDSLSRCITQLDFMQQGSCPFPAAKILVADIVSHLKETQETLVLEFKV